MRADRRAGALGADRHGAPLPTKSRREARRAGAAGSPPRRSTRRATTWRASPRTWPTTCWRWTRSTSARAGFPRCASACDGGRARQRLLHGRVGAHRLRARAPRRRRRVGARRTWLRAVDTRTIAGILGQRPDHELMSLYAQALRELGRFLGRAPRAGPGGRVRRLGRAAGGGAGARHGDVRRPRLLQARARSLAADLALAGVASFADLDRLTIFADNLVPHVLRCEGVLVYDEPLAARIDAGELLPPGGPEREIRACAVHACELLSARTGIPPRVLDHRLWNRGQPRVQGAPAASLPVRVLLQTEPARAECIVPRKLSLGRRLSLGPVLLELAGVEMCERGPRGRRSRDSTTEGYRCSASTLRGVVVVVVATVPEQVSAGDETRVVGGIYLQAVRPLPGHEPGAFAQALEVATNSTLRTDASRLGPRSA